VASDPPPFFGLVGDAPDLAVAVWASGVHAAGLAEAVVLHAEPVQQEIARALDGGGSSGAAAELLGLLARLPGYAPLAAVAEFEHSRDTQVARAASGVLETLRGEAVPERAWLRQRSLELLGLLLLAGPDGRTRDELIRECWPDAARGPRGMCSPRVGRTDWRSRRFTART